MSLSQNDSDSKSATIDNEANAALSAPATVHQPKGMPRLVLHLVRPYSGWLAIVFLAMLVETAMTLATPWPLKIVIDNVIGTRPLPEWLSWIRDLPLGYSQAGLATLAAILYVLIAALGAVASYVDNYYTESVGQYVANDLRMRVYNHLERLSLAYYDTHQTGTLLSTITDDVITIQNFASSATLTILVDLLTIIEPSAALDTESERQDEEVVGRLQSVAHHDWKHSHPLDLSDEGLLTDLAKRGGGGEQLVLGDADK